MRICVVSESLRKPFDEGVKVFVYNLVKEWSREHEVLGLSRSDVGGEIDRFCEKALPDNRLFASTALWRRIKAFRPDLICYLPTAHATVFSFLRARLLAWYGRPARVVLVTLQPREYSGLEERLLSLLAPELILAQSAKTYEQLAGLGCTVRKVSCGVDLEKFVPADPGTRERLRRAYGLRPDGHVALHVGHINRNRNAQFMGELQRVPGVQALLVGSTSYPEDRELVQELRERGVVVLNDFIERIQEVYQCADSYIFPVRSDGACIEVPLSVLEALACNLPVVTTKFGGLPELLPPQAGVLYVDDVGEIPARVQSLVGAPAADTRRIAAERSWKRMAREVLEASLRR